MKPALVFIHGYLGSLAPRHVVWRHWKPNFRAWEARGYRVLVPSLDGTGSLEQRLTKLKNVLDACADDHFILIGHSMGGLDAKGYAIRHDADHRVRAILTSGTPHRGSPLATDMLNGGGILPFLARLIDRGALQDLAHPPAWLDEHALRPDILRRGLMGDYPLNRLPIVARAFGRRLDHLAGPNDAQVSVESARFGDIQTVLEATHWQFCGWNLRHPLLIPDEQTRAVQEHMANAVGDLILDVEKRAAN